MVNQRRTKTRKKPSNKEFAIMSVEAGIIKASSVFIHFLKPKIKAMGRKRQLAARIRVADRWGKKFLAGVKDDVNV